MGKIEVIYQVLDFLFRTCLDLSAKLFKFYLVLNIKACRMLGNLYRPGNVVDAAVRRSYFIFPIAPCIIVSDLNKATPC